MFLNIEDNIKNSQNETRNLKDTENKKISVATGT